MKHEPRIPIPDAARFGPHLLAALSLLAIGVWLTVSLARFQHPFALEWIESGSLQQVGRVLAGKPLYAAPTIEYVPFIYAPLYFHVSALACRVFGESLATLRLVSMLSTLGLLALLFEWARRETGSVRAALLAPGLMAACFRLGGAWFDIARVDMLFLLLAFAALFALRFVRGAAGLLLGAALLALAFHAKQQTLVVAAVMSAWALRAFGARGLLLPAVFASLVAAATIVFNVQTGGWYGYFVFALPGGHGNEWERSGEFLFRDVLGNLPFACLAAACLLFRLPAARNAAPANAAASRSAPRNAGTAFYAYALAAALVTSWLSRIHWGGYDNTLLPACAILSLLAALWSHRFFSAEPAPPSPRLAWVVLGAALAQFGALAYNPLAQLPTERDLAAGRELVARVAATPGEVFIPRHPYLGRLAGKREWMHWMAYYDFIRSARPELAARLRTELKTALARRSFAAIVVDGESDIEGLLETYVPQSTTFASEGEFRPVTGFATRPEFWCVPRAGPGPISTPSGSANPP